MKENRLAKRAVRVVAVALAASLCLALAGCSGEGGGNFSLLIPNMVEFIPMLIAFVLLWVFFAKFAYPVVMGMINKRAKTIEDNISDSEAAKIESARILDERQKMLADAKAEAAKIVADAKKSAEVIREQGEADARAQAKAIIDKANATVAAQRAAAASDLQKSVADISVSVAGKLIGQDLSDDEHRAIIERYVQEAGSLNAG